MLRDRKPREKTGDESLVAAELDVPSSPPPVAPRDPLKVSVLDRESNGTVPKSETIFRDIVPRNGPRDKPSATGRFLRFFSYHRGPIKLP